MRQHRPLLPGRQVQREPIRLHDTQPHPVRHAQHDNHPIRHSPETTNATPPRHCAADPPRQNAVPTASHSLSRWDIAGEPLAERYQQFFLIALGETILVAGLAYSPSPYGPGATAAFAVALVTSILFWRIYIQRAGQILAEAVAKARHPATIGRSAADTHLVMLTGMTATAIGYELSIRHPLAQPEEAWVAMIIGGPVLFLAGRARFEYEVFGRVSPSRWIAILVLLALTPFLPHRGTPLIPATLAAAVLLAVAVADARRARGKPPEAAAPPF
ncbi:low temperature requirement protein A [Micromonospora rhizosphaerae]|uniref:low temperature requirement protein A n=1 Tax=Micromonospora rhizosphaerae TaxID=568872 RepID=UPI000B80A055|nr:low temperature requirement protein A [Micromonospora rhizosphaerae]